MSGSALARSAPAARSRPAPAWSSPHLGLRPDTPLLAAAVAAGIEVIGDVELAWRLRPVLPDGTRQQWLAITGTNGKTTTVRMLLPPCWPRQGTAASRPGTWAPPILTAVTDSEPYPVLAVELSSFQLYWSATLAPLAAVVLNIAAHHLDWHDDIESYVAAKSKMLRPARSRSATPRIRARPRCCGRGRAGRPPGGVPASAPPGPAELGVADGWLTDRAFADSARLAAVSAVRPAAPHNVADALAAAALARAPTARRAGSGGGGGWPRSCRSGTGSRTSASLAASVTSMTPRPATGAAAAASLASFPSIVWIAGGLCRGTDADLEALVAGARPRLRAAVLLGTDRDRFARALARHAPDVPVMQVDGTDTGVMDLVVAQAARLAQPGDTVLLAPAAQSFDLFRDYPARGDAFATAVGRLAASR